jgi:hypothetical protein
MQVAVGDNTKSGAAKYIQPFIFLAILPAFQHDFLVLHIPGKKVNPVNERKRYKIMQVLFAECVFSAHAGLLISINPCY